jgi:hypothetical protein
MCRVGGSAHIDGLVSAQPRRDAAARMRRAGVRRRRRGELNRVPAMGGQMELGPVHDEGFDPVSQPAKSQPP